MSNASMTLSGGTQPKPPIRLGRIAMWIGIWILIFITLFPFYWVLRTALTKPDSVFENATSLLPVDATGDNFLRVIGVIDPKTLIAQGQTNISPGTINFLNYLKNSIIVSALITFGQMFFSSLSAYAFARLRFPFRDQIFFMYLTGLMVPGIVLFIPNYVLIKDLGWINSIPGIVAPSFLMTPFAVFFLRQFFLSLNKDLEEAAKLDGASPFGIFWRVALPMIMGPLITLAILTFVGSWNDYLWPLLVGRGENVRVLTVALGIFRSQTPQGQPDWAGLMAGALVSIAPTLVLFMVFGRRVVDSVQFSGFR